MGAQDRPLEMFTPPPSPCKASTGSGKISTINFWIRYITFSIPIGLKKAADNSNLTARSWQFLFSEQLRLEPST